MRPFRRVSRRTGFGVLGFGARLRDSKVWRSSEYQEKQKREVGFVSCSVHAKAARMDRDWEEAEFECQEPVMARAPAQGPKQAEGGAGF